MLRASFEAADAGITGANFLSAAEGAAIIVTNEGNGDLTRLLPRTHIVLTGIEKVVADLDDVAVLLRLLTRSATGQEISSYVIDHVGPDAASGADSAFHVVLLDNGRSKLLGTEAQDVLRCIRCAACLNHCPIYGAIGGHAYGATYPGPIGAALNPGLIGRQHLSSSQRLDLLRTLRGSLPGEDSAARRSCATGARRNMPTAWRRRRSVFGLGLWAFAAKRPALYRLGTKIMARAAEAYEPQRRGAFAAADARLVRGARFPRAAGQDIPGAVA